ncbi:hypothetical protein [Chelatococcus reniformis]|uniref:Zinc/iron-chelating domain-containing protein n=1 Tax=Chelatococcus reniformis TaxID=1494448 RepID=A0A916UMI1_9HYPH|nr:hypothetical protein [Chelatococcus reniformis]GGC78748.1 hypothetical protein GCM10010994_41110 [Chelatococcus reniformis]
MTASAQPRQCGTCALCCKVMGIVELDKPRGRWCPHCRPGQGCTTYDDRPEECRTFSCLWLTQDFLGEEWKPDRSKLVLYTEHDANRLVVQVDTGAAQAWRREPFFSQIKAWAQAGVDSRRQVLVVTGELTTLVLPDREVALGKLAEGDLVIVRPRLDAGRPAYDVQVERKGMSPG